MPETLTQWAWWLFYTAGSLGGLLCLALLAVDMWATWRR